jgi:hypothetical protein
MPKSSADASLFPIDQAFKLAKSLAESEWMFHESTSPAVIAAGQRKEVKDYLKAHRGATVAEISAALCLPEWSVECRIAELNGKKRPYRIGKPRLNDAGEKIPNPHAPFFGGKHSNRSRAAAV